MIRRWVALIWILPCLLLHPASVWAQRTFYFHNYANLTDLFLTLSGLPDDGALLVVGTTGDLWFRAHLTVRSVMLPDAVSPAGIDRQGAAFCYPGELSHGFFHSILSQTPPPDYIFLPHMKSIPSLNGDSNSQLCPFVQGEGYYLKTAFRHELEHLKLEIRSRDGLFAQLPDGQAQDG